MLRASNQDERYRRAEIDIAPMIDCVFILLIFFVVTSVFVADPGVEVNKPDAAGVPIADRDALIIAITADDRLFFDSQQVRLDQVAGLVRQAAIAKEATIIIRADRSTSHGTFAAVYAEAKRAGIARVLFATNRTEEP